MEQELLLKAQFLQSQVQELEQNLEIFDKEILELQKMSNNLEFLSKTNETSSVSSIGKGIHIKTNIASKELFVEAGAGIVIKKSPKEALSVIKNQIGKLTEARLHLLGKIEIYNGMLASVAQNIEDEQEKPHEHSHNEHCNHKH